MTTTVTVILTIIAIILGPILSVQISQYLDRKRWDKERKLKVFKDLMSTRSANLSFQHIQGLNMIDVEFDPKVRLERDVVSAWKFYLAHLQDTNYPKETWESRRVDLLIDLLHIMAKSLDYNFDKAHIKNASYYPRSYGDLEDDQYVIRKGTIELLQGKRSMPIHIIDKPES